MPWKRTEDVLEIMAYIKGRPQFGFNTSYIQRGVRYLWGGPNVFQHGLQVGR